MKSICAFLAIVALSSTMGAEPANPPMTKIVTQLKSARIAPDSFAAKPKTLYLAGDTYARIEEEPDAARGLHGLVIISEPDMWLINLADQTGKHQVDPGPTFVVHSNIMPPGGPKEFSTLEFGKELEFFKSPKVTSAPAREIAGKSCVAQEYIYGEYRLLLLTAKDTGLPVQLEVYRDGALNVTVRYLSYERDLPFNAALFKPPEAVKMTEANGK